MLSTLDQVQKLTAEQKKVKVEKARTYHSTLLNDAGADPKDFTLKLMFMNKGDKVIGVFDSEFRKPNGFFLEFADGNLEPIDPKRKVYRLAPRSNYADQYHLLSSGAYAVPVEELEVVELKVAKELNPKVHVNMSEFATKSDDHYSKMTISDLAAILWMKPVSEKEWLNELIKQNIS